MKVGINLLLWGATITDEHVPILEHLAVMGYDGVEFPIFSCDPEQAKRLRKELDRLKLKCTATVCVPPDASPISENGNERRKAVNFLKKALGVCEILGTEVIAGPFTAPVGHLVGRPRTDDEWKWAVDSMSKFAGEAQKRKIPLALEAINRFETYFINTTADACRLANEVNNPYFNIMWDTFHANIEEENIVNAMKDAGKQIAHVHVSENHRGIPGDGHIRFGEVFRALKELKYDGWLTIEAFGSALPELAAATCIWRDLFSSRDELAQKGLQFIKKQWEKK